ncbi:MAG: ABC transporter permease [Actinobacteria bacterium]|nr:MAG: ABC transporter permease [Actinomycetota bacterium]
MVGVVLAVAAKDLRQRLRDRSALVLAFVAPFGLAAIISLAFSQFAGQAHVTLAVTDLDGGPRAAALLTYLRAPELARVVTIRPLAENTARALAAHDHVDAAVVIPAGYSAGEAPLAVLSSPANPVAGAVAQALADGFSSRSGQSNGDVHAPAITVESRTGHLGGVSAASYYGPSMAIIFVFFTVAFGSRSLLGERELGTFRRLVAAPVRVQAVVAGKVLATFVLGLTSMLVMWIAVSRVFGATWGGALPVVSLCVGVVLAAMGITSLAAALATTEEEADGIGAGLTFVLALLGGNFIQLYLLPSAMQRVARFTPNGWALRAFVDLTAGGRARSVAPAVAVLAAFGLVTGGLALRRARWAEST